MHRARRAGLPALIVLVILLIGLVPGRNHAETTGYLSPMSAGQCRPWSSPEVQTGGTSASDEFVEVANQGVAAVDIGGLELVYVTSTGGTITRKATWTSPTLLEPGRRVLAANSAGIYAGIADSSYSGGLAATGGAMMLRVVGGTPIDAVGWGDAVTPLSRGPPPARHPPVRAWNDGPALAPATVSTRTSTRTISSSRGRPRHRTGRRHRCPGRVPFRLPRRRPCRARHRLRRRAPTATPRPEPTPTPQPTPSPESTPAPSPTPTPTPPTPTRTPTPAPTPTADPTPTPVDDAHALADARAIAHAEPRPDGHRHRRCPAAAGRCHRDARGHPDDCARRARRRPRWVRAGRHRRDRALSRRSGSRRLAGRHAGSGQRRRREPVRPAHDPARRRRICSAESHSSCPCPRPFRPARPVRRSKDCGSPSPERPSVRPRRSRTALG